MKIYFSGLGGVAIGPLAQIAQDSGHTVIGSDRAPNLMTNELEARGITVSYDQSGAFLRSTKDIDWFVYTAALPNDHPELLAARELGVKISKRDELLAHIVKEHNLTLLAVAGTHGKTTTSGTLTWALQQLGIPVSYSIGTTLTWGPSGKFDPQAKYFVYECDEFDRNFLNFNPAVSLITSIEYDHPDTYPTENDYKAAFRQFIDQSSASILWHNDARYIDLENESSWILGSDETIVTRLVGAHNRRNATLVLKTLERLSIGSPQERIDTLESFPSTDRRFEKLADNLYTDYGHTPSEIAATLQMAREINDHVTLVYQPHQNVRQHLIRAQYIDTIFADATEVYWLPTYLSREDETLETLTPKQLTEQLDHTKLHIADIDDALLATIQKARANNSLVLVMGAGSIDSWIRSKI